MFQRGEISFILGREKMLMLFFEILLKTHKKAVQSADIIKNNENKDKAE